MKQICSALYLVLLLATIGKVAAQIPPVHVKPTAMIQQDTLVPVIKTSIPDFETIKDPDNGRVVYKGLFSYNEMEQEPSFSWLVSGMDTYTPNAEAQTYLSTHLKQYSVLVFLGTWCGDSKEVIPKLFKLLGNLNISYQDLMMVGMDRSKKTTTKAGKKLIRKYKVAYLPTIVLVDANGKEAGRITESVSKSVEEDLAAIIKKDKE